MKTLNLYFDMEFTSLSPDAQPISLGIVSDEISYKDYASGMEINTNPILGVLSGKYKEKSYSKSFYAEFSDFDINRCDDWVKLNVIPKTDIGYNKKYQNDYEPVPHYLTKDNFSRCVGDTDKVIKSLKEWLSQFSDYQIQFVKDAQSTKGTGLDWLTLVEILRIDNPLKDYVFIEMTKGYKTIIDISDYESVSKHSWCAHVYKNKCYPETRIKGKAIRLHQFLMGEQPFENAIIDHKNGNSLDNRKSNLRWITQQQNNHNTSSRKSTSKYKGVRWHENLNKWSAFISKRGKYFHLGMYEKEEDAAKAYNERAKCFFGEFCKLNEFNYFPQLPQNISPVPFDLNDLISIKKGITPKEAFDLDREGMISVSDVFDMGGNQNKHNAIWDSKVIKEIYNKLK